MENLNEIEPQKNNPHSSNNKFIEREPTNEERWINDVNKEFDEDIPLINEDPIEDIPLADDKDIEEEPPLEDDFMAGEIPVESEDMFTNDDLFNDNEDDLEDSADDMEYK